MRKSEAGEAAGPTALPAPSSLSRLPRSVAANFGGRWERGRGDLKILIYLQRIAYFLFHPVFFWFVFDTPAPHSTSRPVFRGGGKRNKRGSEYKDTGEVGKG